MRQIGKQLTKGLKSRNEAAAMGVPGAFPRPGQVYVVLLEEGPFFSCRPFMQLDTLEI